ncbi:MAG TPA: Calx-beta domain-containing protein [Pyrinomonadaceae bacterium]
MKNAIKIQSKNYFLGLVQLILTIAFLTGAAQATTYTVTTLADNGAGSLRQAILDANASFGADTINFNIPGSGVRSIFPQMGELPEITDSLTINGATQPNYTGNPLIEINGSALAGQLSGITVRNGAVVIKALVIRNFGGDGIYVYCVANCAAKPPSLHLTGSRIGTNSDGTIDAGNGSDGIDISAKTAATSQIGGTGANEKNVISGNGFNGINIYNSLDQSPDNSFLIVNNMIGTNLAGTAALPNGGNGISLLAERVTIGGDAPAERNVISGNTYNGISIAGYHNSDGYNVIEGNYIGTNAAGTAALGNQHAGIILGLSDHNRIGGLQPGTGNVISGNGWSGISFSTDAYIPQGQQATAAFGPNNTLIYGNKIGTNAAGTAAVGNGSNGISIVGDNNSIGLGGVAASANIIAGNVENGIVIHDVRQWYGNLGPQHAKSKGNKIENNFIGTNSAGADLGNTLRGVLLLGEVSDTLIGGAGVSQNTIAFNDSEGVALVKAEHPNMTTIPVDAQITANKIYSNGLHGIGFYENDGQGNDSQDADEGINHLQNAPVLNSAYADSIVGTLNSTPNKTFNLDFYSSPSCDNSGRGEGQTYLDSISVTTDANGNASFVTGFGASSGAVITATATAPPASGNAYGSTSEFSQCVASSGQFLSKFSFSAATYSVNENGSTATITVTRTGALSTASINYATVVGGTTTHTQDFSVTNGTLTFTPGQISKTFTVPIVNDTTDEPDETINLALSSPSANAILVNPSTAVLTITDNDNPPTVSIKNYSAQEGNSGTTAFTFNVTLSEASGLPVSVKWKTLSGGTATPGSDYTAADGTLNFAPGETSKQITILVNGDAVSEPNEYFQVNIYQPVNVTLDDNLANGTIFDEDNPGEVQFSQVVYNVNEGVGTATVTVTRTTGTVGTVTVDYATTNTGTTSFPDFTHASGTLTFLDGEVTKTFSVSITDDQIVEQTEWIDLVLSNATGGAAISAGNALINIADNDEAAATSISGNINYAITPINQSQKKVPGVLVYANGPGNGGDTSDSDGAYQINNLTAGGNYTVAASKTGDVNGISPFDATLVLKHVAANGQGPNVLSLNQQKAADANGDGNITPFDATLILRYVAANGPTPNTGQTGNWKFLPGTQNYQSLNNSLSGENYEAILIGEINGDWKPPVPGSLAPMDNQGETINLSENAEAEISLPDNAPAANGSIIVVPVTFANKSGKSVSGYNFEVAFDPNVLQPDSAMPIDTSATLSREMTVVHDTAQTGRIGIAASGGNSNERIAKGDVLLKLRFRVVGTANDLKNTATALTFHHQPIIENESGTTLTVKSADGSVRVSAGGGGKSVTMISGRITTADGLGIRNVSVTLAGANGETRTVMTGAGGEYHFTDVQVGETYTISVSSKRFRFNSASQMRAIFAEAEEINFTALE